MATNNSNSPDSNSDYSNDNANMNDNYDENDIEIANNLYRPHMEYAQSNRNIDAFQREEVIRSLPERYMLHTLALGAGGNDGEAGDVGDIGDFNHVVGTPTVEAPNRMAHNGGGDAEMMFEMEQRGAGDAAEGGLMAGEGHEQEQELHQEQELELGLGQEQELGQAQLRVHMEQRRQRSVEHILRLCDFIQQQLATITAQIAAYEKKLALQSAASARPQPDGDDL